MNLFGWPPPPRHGDVASSGHLGVRYVVFRPPWWKPWLWLAWPFLKRSGRAWGYIDVPAGKGRLRVRVIAEARVVPRPPGSP